MTAVSERLLGTQEKPQQPFSSRERQLFTLFESYPGRVLKRTQIEKAIWDSHVGQSAVRTTIDRLRKKLPDRGVIVTAKGGGYCYGPVEEHETQEKDQQLSTSTKTFFSIEDREVLLGPSEYEYVSYLEAHPGRVVSGKELSSLHFGSNKHKSAVSHTISRARNKIEPDPARPRFLLTTPTGYKFVKPT